MEETEFCKCEHSSSVYTEMDMWGHWDVCNDCSKPVEGTYEYFSDEISIDND